MKKQILDVTELRARWDFDYKDILYLIKKQEILWYTVDTLQYESLEEEAKQIKQFYDLEGSRPPKSIKQLRDAERLEFDLYRLKNEEENIFFKVKDIEAYEKKHPELIHTRPDAAMTFLDPDNKYYSEELDIAVKAWETLFGNSGTFKEGKVAPKKQIEKWLKANYKHLANNSIERIATLINPLKRGGAPVIEPEE